MLLDLPHDIRSYILCKLRLNEIGNIRRTCSTLNSFVTNDKQLWLHILDRDIKLKALPLPKYIRDIDASTAQDAIEWIKSSIYIDKNYSSGEGKTLIRESFSMSVTWSKLVRGRWCLISCSDLRESQLVVWDLQASQDEYHKATFYLPGPVVDGILEDNKHEVLIALTIGTKIANILLLQLCTDKNEVFLQQILEIPAASHVRLLKRPYIGFAVRDGDDTNPTILNWETGCLRSLITHDPVQGLAINDAWPLALRHVACRGMFIWRNLVIVLDTGKLAVFGNPGNSDQFDDDVLSNSQCMQVHYLDGAYVDVFVLNYEYLPTANGYQDTLCLILREGSGLVVNLLIRYDEANEALGKLVFVTPVDRLELPILNNNFASQATTIALGPTCGRFLTLAVIRHESWPMPTIYVAQNILTEESAVFGPAVPLSTDGMLLLFDVTCMDFDDGIGLFVVGTHRGEVCIRTFGASFPPCNHNSDLPSLQASPDFKAGETLDQFVQYLTLIQIRIPVELPTIYEVHSLMSSQESRQKLNEEAFRAWGTVAPVPHLLGWSSDWPQFRNKEQWVASFPRWGIFDKIVNDENMIAMRIRMRLGTLGEIVPVLFDESNHFRVLFRVGDRLYFCKSKNEDPMANYDEDFDGDVDIIGIFPITFTQFLETSPMTITELIDDHWMQRNIESDESSLAAENMADQEWMFNCVKETLVKQLGEYPGDKVLESWSNSEWTAMRKVAGFYQGFQS